MPASASATDNLISTTGSLSGLASLSQLIADHPCHAGTPDILTVPARRGQDARFRGGVHVALNVWEERDEGAYCPGREGRRRSSARRSPLPRAARGARRGIIPPAVSTCRELRREALQGAARCSGMMSVMCNRHAEAARIAQQVTADLDPLVGRDEFRLHHDMQAWRGFCARRRESIHGAARTRRTRCISRARDAGLPGGTAPTSRPARRG